MTRAQEAEENYVIKRELAVVRQQCNTASESLEKAQDTIKELQQQKVNTNPQSVHKQPHANCHFPSHMWNRAIMLEGFLSVQKHLICI